MIDLIFWAQTKAQFETFARGRGFMVADEETGNTVTIRYVDLTWWAGSGKFAKVLATYDTDGNEVTPAVYEPGFFCYVRQSGPVYEDDTIEPAEGETKPWHRSTLARSVRGTGAGSSILDGQVSAYQSGQVRIVDPDDFVQYIADNNLPGHEWLGGNSF